MNYKGLNSPQRRLREFRNSGDLTLRQLTDAVNQFLPEDQQVTHATVSNYETSTHPPPRADWLAALKRAFPGLRIEWVVSGVGAMTEEQERWRQAPDEERLIMLTKVNWHGLPHGTHSVFEELLSALLRTADEPVVPFHLQQFAGEQVAKLVYAPFGQWGYLSPESVSPETLRLYATAVLNALTLLVAAPGSAALAELEELEDQEEAARVAGN